MTSVQGPRARSTPAPLGGFHTRVRLIRRLAAPTGADRPRGRVPAGDRALGRTFIERLPSAGTEVLPVLRGTREIRADHPQANGRTRDRVAAVEKRVRLGQWASGG